MCNQDTKNRSIMNLICICSLCILFVIIFYGAYFHLLSLDKHIAKEPIMTVNIEPSYKSQTNNEVGKIYLSEEQFTKLENRLVQASENNLTVSKLSDFYASLFTAIAVIMAIIALISWRTLKDRFDDYDLRIANTENNISDFKDEITSNLNNFKIDKETLLNQEIDKLTRANESFEKLKIDVEPLLTKKEYALWVKEDLRFEDFEASFRIDYNPEEIKQINKYLQHFQQEQEENVLVGISIAKYLLSPEKGKIDEAENVFNTLLRTTVLPNSSSVKPLFYSFLGQFQKIKYDEIKLKDETTLDEMEDVLKLAEDYYKTSIAYSSGKEQLRACENLVVVLIEKGKINLKRWFSNNDNNLKEAAVQNFNEANEILRNEKIKDFNTYWDLARVEFYQNDLKITPIVNEHLNQTILNIKTRAEGQIFLRKLRQELYEFKSYNVLGFPGDIELINRLEYDLNKMLI